MSSVQNGWLLDYGLVEEIQGSEFIWAPAPQIVDDPTSSVIFGFDVSQKDDNCQENSCNKKRTRPESCAAPGSKACREKLRRDKLNERFVELSSIVDPGKPPKADKVAILSDAARLLNQLRAEAQKLKKSNETLQDAIKALKAEKSELRDEKVRLKSEKERIEQMLKGVSFSPQFIAHPAAAFYAAPFAASNKSTPYTNYPPRSFLQWIPPAALDTSKDPVCWPPVA
ncbi:transcription factor ILR3-like isoform X1 [Typha latifolia]|uniref:transcription factor ILR3-like isoform X1 n=1 Tax=Typha latifolia TaxID=4733 RepID=UPI003C2C4298